jgi:transcriptional regulator of acetoin/glycerol metabolism
MTVQEAEKRRIIRALQDTHGNRTQAAKLLGMSRRTLYRKLGEYQLESL